MVRCTPWAAERWPTTSSQITCGVRWRRNCAVAVAAPPKGTGNARYPDALIDCGRFVPSAIQAQEPTVVFEVPSKSTAWIDQNLKLRDYDATQTIMHYVLISQDEPRVMVYTRGDDGRLDLRAAMLLTGVDATVRSAERRDLGSFGCVV
jgi:hypothetical protein